MSRHKDGKAERANSLLFILYVLSRLSMDWMRPIQLGKAVCFTQCADSNVNFIQKHPHRHIQNNVWAIPGYLITQSSWHMKLTNTIFFSSSLYSGSITFLIKFTLRASLVAQWLRICLPMQGTRVRALVWEEPACRGAAGPVSHNYWACESGACAPH